MKIGFIILFISLFITCYSAYSQDVIAVDKWKEYVEDLSDESLDEARLETLYADLSYMNPWMRRVWKRFMRICLICPNIRWI